VNFLNSLINAAKSAWSNITGTVVDWVHAAEAIWHYVTNLHNLLSWITGNPVLNVIKGALAFYGDVAQAIINITDAMSRLEGWIYWKFITPALNLVWSWIENLYARVLYFYRKNNAYITWVFYVTESYARNLAGVEQRARIADVNKARQQAIALVKAALQTVQDEASSGYDAGLDARRSRLGKLGDIIATHNPAVRGLVNDLAKYLIDLAEVDNPLVRILMGQVITHVIDDLGVDKIAGNLLGSLAQELTQNGIPHTLYDVCRDIDGRLNALEDSWVTFMDNGGPEIEQAGKEWKDITSLLVDVGALGLFVSAAADPAGWADTMSTAIGDPVNAAAASVIDLIMKG
jgi:hypothetical protein